MISLLEGVTVVECGVLQCGPALTSHLADLGADVIKIEAPPLGDYGRDIIGAIGPRESPMFLQINKNKRSVMLDLRKDEGREIFWRLLDRTTVFVDGYMPGTCERLGIGYDEQVVRRPDIIYCQHSGFGANGPYSQIPAHGRMMNAAAGSYPVEVLADGMVHPKDDADGGLGGAQEGGEATSCGAVYGALFVAAAIVRLRDGGGGAHIDLSASDAVIANAWSGVVYAANSHRIVDRSTMPAPSHDRPKLVDPPPARALEGARYFFYETNDAKFVLFAAMERKFWHRFCQFVSRVDLMDEADPDFDFAYGDRRLYDELRQVFLTRTQSDWLDIAAAHDLPIGPVNRSVADLLVDPHISRRQVLVDGRTPSGGPFTYVGTPAIIQGQPFEVRRVAPLVGEHSAEVLAELGYTSSQIDHMNRRGVT